MSIFWNDLKLVHKFILTKDKNITCLYTLENGFEIVKTGQKFGHAGSSCGHMMSRKTHNSNSSFWRQWHLTNSFITFWQFEPYCEPDCQSNLVMGATHIEQAAKRGGWWKLRAPLRYLFTYVCLVAKFSLVVDGFDLYIFSLTQRITCVQRVAQELQWCW